ncbi:MAG: DNA helicase RecQ [Bacteroidales bacterium]|nr:DNA helicase RecQ [Bacteroidales bacterium]MBQ9312519.1 DNA helicase RecQ [Bacteroidales bacterium]
MSEEMYNLGNIDLYQELKRIFGFSQFKGYQENVIKDILQGKNVFVIMPTGGGKSLCYQFPALIMKGTAIIISPLISLMKNQVDAIREMVNDTSIAHFMNSSLNKHEMNAVKNDIVQGKTKLLYVAPESLTKQENAEFLSTIPISFYAIDEAHCISEWGHDFRPEYRRIREIVNSIGQDVPIIALTATATEKVKQDILKNLDIPEADVFVASFNRENLYYEIRPKPTDEKQLLKQIIAFIKENEHKSGIIYCLSRKKVEEVAELLNLNNIKALPYHAGLDAATRAENQDKFILEDIDVIVATIAFGMGIDKPDVRYVIHYDMPKSLEGYYQETGRAGRDGGEGKCIAFYSEKDISKLERFLIDKTVPEREVATQLMEATISYAESAVCRRVNLLKYFGEDYKQDNCHNCDNCLHPKKKVNAREDIKSVIELIQATRQMFKTAHILDVIMGRKTSAVKTCKHDKLEWFGLGANDKETHWKAVVRQCIIEGFIRKDIESYGVLKLQQDGYKYLQKSYDILVPEDHDFNSENEDDYEFVAKGQETSAVDDVLFSILKDIRKSIATKEKLPPYIIFEDRSLNDMTIQYPTSIEEMKNIVGVGEAKAKKYGQEFCDTIKRYVEDNDIEKPQELVVKSLNNKSGLKVYIIKSIDKKLSLEDIAKGKGLEIDELLDTIEKIVASGTKLDLSYYIEENVDPYHQEEIMDCLKEMETDNVKEVLEELGEDEYTEEEVRLMRIYFISKYGQ